MEIGYELQANTERFRDAVQETTARHSIEGMKSAFAFD